ncbi:MAG TPA: DHH family phosphoesterase, partial [Candidatus Saccharimonadales bacterium]|nr:DHH family phosphoesterase [Candidatus Saccharimonadales bacterium]
MIRESSFMDKELTPKQQTSEAIRQAETILIMTGQHPSIDQVASTVALSAILRKFGKKVTAVVSDDIPAGAKFLSTNLIERTLGGLRDFIVQVDLGHAEVDKLKYTIENGKLNIHVTPFAGGFQPRDMGYAYGDYQFDLVIILGVASYSRIDKVYAQNAELLRRIPLVNIDFHRINEQYGAINLVETSAASLAEILIALSESLQTGLIDEAIATTMLTGIMASTDRFTATHTTAKTMTVAAQMLAMGADQQRIVKGLYRSDRDRVDRDRPDRDKRPQPPRRDNREPAKPEVKPAPQVHQLQQSPSQAQDAPPRPARPRPESQPAPRPQFQPRPQPASQPESQPIVQESIEEEDFLFPPELAQAYEEPQLPAAPIAQPTPDPVDTDPIPMPAPSQNQPPKVAPRPAEPVSKTQPTSQPRSSAIPMEELLPPQHIQISEADSANQAQSNPLTTTEPEPLINDTSDRRPKP